MYLRNFLGHEVSLIPLAVEITSKPSFTFGSGRVMISYTFFPYQAKYRKNASIIDNPIAPRLTFI